MIEPQENRHINLGNTNMNQFIPNEMIMNKNYIQQQQNYNRIPTNIYNMPISIEQNQLFNNMNNQQNNFPFGVNEDAMKHKKITKKIQKSPNEGNMVNMNPNMNVGNMMNIPNLHFPGQNINNNKFFKNNNNASLNNKGSLSMQGNKNTMPNFNPNLNLNFMIPQKSPQAPQNTIPQNIMNQNLNLNMSQRNFYNNPNNNMNKSKIKIFLNFIIILIIIIIILIIIIYKILIYNNKKCFSLKMKNGLKISKINKFII